MGKTITNAVVAIALWLAIPLVAQAAGLGKLTVLSPLGQPLNAEIEIVALQPGEEEGLVARLAAPEAFNQAGIEFNPVLSDARFAVERRGGRPLLRVRTSQPVNEPFLELLVELQWPSGRLVREYTFLLDPPEYKSRVAIAPVAPAPAAAAPPKPAPEPEAAAAPEQKPVPPAEEKPIEPTPAPAAAPTEPAAATPTPTPTPTPAPKPAYEVQKGDTLGKIAKQNLAPGITLNQMLLALYRANEDAFIRKNVNLVRAGRILNIPDQDAVGTIDRAEADRIVKEHMAQFAEYRSRLAAVPTSAEATPGQQAATGRIEMKPEAPASAAPQDQLRLSKADPKKPAAPAAQAARDDDLAARDRALKEAQSRVADLEKNVADLRKLLELKNQQLAELEKKAVAKPAPATPVAQGPEKPAAKAPEKPAAETPKPAPAPAAKAPEKPAAEALKPPAEAAKPPTEAAKPVPSPEAKKPEAPKPKPQAAPPPPPAGMVDEFLDNPLYLGLLAAVVLLLVAYAYIAWRRKKVAQAKFQDSVLGAAAAGGAGGGAAGEPTLGGPTGGGAGPGSQGAVSQPSAGMAAEEVDPIAEADVYMAYGRDAQAEEILKEVLQKDPNRVAVHAKLLEIYANRRDAKSFEQSALKLKGLTNGTGPEWEKAAALGRSIDPQNGVYGGASAAAAAPAASAAAAAPALDFDIGGGGGAAQTSPSAPDIALDAAPKEASPPVLDFDISGAAPAGGKGKHADATVATGSSQPEKSTTNIDFNLDLGGAEQPGAAAPAAPASEPGGGLDFDLNIDAGSGGEKKTEPEKPPAAMDLSSISLDLGSPGEAPAAPAGGDPKWQEVATKLDLAKAYEEMGDKDGARELLNEVVKDGDAAQKGMAQQLLAKLG